jgi:hypothetical protein
VEQLAKLGVLLGKNWQKALQVVDQNEVICYQAEPSGRKIFEVCCESHIRCSSSRIFLSKQTAGARR